MCPILFNDFKGLLCVDCEKCNKDNSSGCMDPSPRRQELYQMATRLFQCPDRQVALHQQLAQYWFPGDICGSAMIHVNNGEVVQFKY